MLRHLARRLAVLAAVLFAPSLGAQQSSPSDSIQTPHGTCRVWIGIPGGSNHETDRSYAPCAVDRPAALLSDPALPQPSIGTSMGGEFTVVVNADGRVEPRLTRAWSLSMDSVAYRRTLETLRQWRFRPARRGGEAVRSGFILQVHTDPRVDTLPAELRWTYRQSVLSEDSLVGRWVALAARPAPLTAEQHDSLYTALFRRLVHMRVLAPWLEQPYCIVTGDGDTREAHARVSELLRRVIRAALGTEPHGYHGYEDEPGRVLAYGCERQPGALRLFLPTAYRTEGNRVVLAPAGDYLAEWRPGYGGGTFPGWTGRCVMDVPAGAPSRVHCEINPRITLHGPRPWERKPSPRWYQPGDSIHVTVIARPWEAFQTDTLRAVVQDLRRFSGSAVLDADGGCASSWSAFTAQDSGALYVVKGNVDGRLGFHITDVRHGPPPPRPGIATCAGQPRDSLLAVFFLGDLGDPIRAPVTFCMGDPLCTRQHEVDPARHTLAERAAIRFRIQDLREMTRVGDQLEFRVYVDPVPEGLVPLVLVRQGGRMPLSLWPARRVELDAWEFIARYDPAISPDSEISIYLVAR